MNQFSDLLATDLAIDIEIKLQPVVQNGAPCVRIICNDCVLFDDQLQEEQMWKCSADMLGNIDLCIELSGKQYCAERETAVVIKSVKIDRFEIVPAWTHLVTYENDKNTTDPTSYLGFNGTWRLQIAEPFYRWRHRVTGQGWLLEPTTAVRDCVPSSSNTIDD